MLTTEAPLVRGLFCLGGVGATQVTAYQEHFKQTRTREYLALIERNSFERLTLEDRLAAMPQQISTAHGIETPHVFQQTAKPAVKPKRRPVVGLDL